MRRIVATSTAMHTADPSRQGRLAWACRTTGPTDVTVAQARLDYQRLTQELEPLRPSLFVQGATESARPEPVRAAYDAPFPDEPSCAGPRQLPLLMGLTPSSACARLNRRTLDALGRFDRPLLTAFSSGDVATHGWAELLQALVPGAVGQEHVTSAGADHFLHEDRGEELAAAVAQLLAATPD